jgi:hypothetical protein
MHGEWGQDKVVLWLWPDHLKDAVEQNLSSLAFARYNLRESGEWGCAEASWQEGTFLNMALACLEVFGRCDERLLSVLPLWICNLKSRGGTSFVCPATALQWHDIASAPSLGYHALKTK